MTGRIASKLTMNSHCTHWVSDPSPPVWIERQEQEAVALRAAALCFQGSFPASSDAGEEPSSSAGGGEWGHPSGDGDLEVGAGTGAGDVGS